MMAHVIETNDEDGNLIIEVQYPDREIHISPRFAPALQHLASEAAARLQATPICDSCNANASWQSDDGAFLCARHAADAKTAWKI